VTLVDRAEWLASMITEFLDAPMPVNPKIPRAESA